MNLRQLTVCWLRLILSEALPEQQGGNEPMKPEEFEKLFKNVPEHVPDPKLMAELEEEFSWMDEDDIGGEELLPDLGELPVINIDDIVTGANPRQNFAGESYDILLESIKAHESVTVPLILRPIDESKKKFEIIDGERRYRAAKEAGLKLLPCHIIDVNAGQASLMRIVANLQREELGAMEFSLGLNATIKENPNIKETELAKRLGMSASRLSNAKQLSTKIPKKIHEYFIKPNKEGKVLTQKHGETLYPLISAVEEKRVNIKKVIDLAGEAYRTGMRTAELRNRVQILLGQSKPSVLSATTQTAITNFDSKHGKKVSLNLTSKKADIKIDFTELNPDEDLGSIMADIEALLTAHIGELALISTNDSANVISEENPESSNLNATSTNVVEFETPLCAKCGFITEKNDRFTINGEIYCGYCIIGCLQCGDIMLKTDAITRNNRTLCKKCAS